MWKADERQRADHLASSASRFAHKDPLWRRERLRVLRWRSKSIGCLPTRKDRRRPAMSVALEARASKTVTLPPDNPSAWPKHRFEDLLAISRKDYEPLQLAALQHRFAQQ